MRDSSWNSMDGSSIGGVREAMLRIFLYIAILVAGAWITGCTTENEHGECIGFASDRKPDLVYKVSYWNVAMGALGAELLLIPPAYVLLEAHSCPVGKKETK